MHKLYAACLLLCSALASAGTLNVEFNFTPFIGDPASTDHVETVPGTAQVFINNVLLAKQEIEKRTAMVMFEERQITPAVWLRASSLGPVVRKGRNLLRIEFQPSDANTAYQAQLRWATVTDQVRQEETSSSLRATNQSDEGASTQQGRGTLVFEREFSADFMPDLPWHHYPPVTILSDADKQALATLVKMRVDAFKPNFAGVYPWLSGRANIDVATLKKAKCLDKAYAAGVRIAPPAPTQLDFQLTGNPEVVIRHKANSLYELVDPKAIERIKGDEMQICASMAILTAYPPRLSAVRLPSGTWAVVY